MLTGMTACFAYLQQLSSRNTIKREVGSASDEY